LDRTEPILRLRKGIHARQTHDYIHHGTTNLFAALQLRTHKIHAKVEEWFADHPRCHRHSCTNQRLVAQTRGTVVRRHHAQAHPPRHVQECR
jgi:hypothetical protein